MSTSLHYFSNYFTYWNMINYLDIKIFPFIVSEDGLLVGADDVFIGVKKAKDYHSEMNGEHFENYLK